MGHEGLQGRQAPYPCLRRCQDLPRLRRRDQVCKARLRVRIGAMLSACLVRSFQCAGLCAHERHTVPHSVPITSFSFAIPAHGTVHALHAHCPSFMFQFCLILSAGPSPRSSPRNRRHMLSYFPNSFKLLSGSLAGRVGSEQKPPLLMRADIQQNMGYLGLGSIKPTVLVQ